MPTKVSRYCDGIIEAVWIAAIVVIPIFFNIYSSRIFEPDKIAILRSLALIILAAWIVKLLDEGGIRWGKLEKRSSFIETISGIPLLIPVLAMAAVYLVATIFSVTPHISLWGSYQRLQGTYTFFSYLIVFASVVGNLRRRSQVDRLITTIILTSLPIGLYGILQKYGIDPVPWGGDVSRRIAANMGNSIFVAAYLIMTVPLTIGRIIDSFEKILNEDEQLSSNVLRATIYVFIGAVEFIAIYMSGSRGPLLGLLAGLFFMFILLSVYWRKRMLTIGTIGAASFIVIFLLLLSIPNGPLEFIRQAPGVGRFGQVLNMEERTSRVRILIWQGASELVLPHDPLFFPDGTSDKYNIIRPLIGYGPESMYVAYNQFYPPELGRVEKRNASPDRSHNETWDSLVTTGLLGFIAYLVLFGSIFYYGLKWVGLIRDDNQRRLFIICLGVGSLIGGVGLLLWQGVGFLGVGIPFGLLVGLIIYITLVALFSENVYEFDEFNHPRIFILIILLGGIVAHFAEINFGIAIVATRTYFWIFTGLLLVIGYVFQFHDESELVESGNSTAIISDGYKNPGNRKRTKKSRRTRSLNPSPIFGKQPPWSRKAVISALITSILLISIGYNFISNPISSSSISKIVSNSLTRLPNQDNAVSFGVLALIITTWLSSAAVFASENSDAKNLSGLIKSFFTIISFSFITVIIYWLWHAGTLARLAAIKPTDQFEVIDQISRIGGLLTRYYIYLFIMILVMGIFLPKKWVSKGGVSLYGFFALPAALLFVVFGAYWTNVRVIQSDIAFKMAEPFANTNQWPISTFIYQRAIELTPNEDHYYLFLGKSYLEQAKDVEREEEQDALVQQAENDLKVAQSINPLNTDHTANLGRLYSWWASRIGDLAQQNEKGLIASQYYATAVKLSPNNPNLWNEWAILFMDVIRNSNEALEKLSQSLQIDSQYGWTHSLLGEFYIRLARASDIENTKRDNYMNSIVHFEEAVAVSTNREADAKVGYLISLGNVYIEMANNFSQDKDTYIKLATDQYLTAIEIGPRKNDLWKIEETLSRLYAQLGDKQNALIHANAALSAAPSEQQENLQSLIAQIQTLP